MIPWVIHPCLEPAVISIPLEIHPCLELALCIMIPWVNPSMFRTSSEYDEAPVLPAVPKLIVKLGPDTPERIDSPSALPIFSPDPEHHHRHKEKKKKKKKDKKKSHEKDKDRDREHRHHKKKKKREYASVEDGYPASPTVQPPLKVLLNIVKFMHWEKIGRIGFCYKLSFIKTIPKIGIFLDKVRRPGFCMKSLLCLSPNVIFTNQFLGIPNMLLF